MGQPVLLTTTQDGEQTFRVYKLKDNVDLSAHLDKLKAARPNALLTLERLDTQSWPDHETLQDWVMDSVCEATDGCEVEPDGICPHNKPSWLLAMGLC